MNNSGWYAQMQYDGKALYGAAALNVRIKNAGGMDALIQTVATRAIETVMAELNKPLSADNNSIHKSRVKQVAN